MVKTNCSTLLTVYNMQQSATRGSNETTHRLSRRTAATTRFSPETDVAKVLPTSDLVGLYLVSIHQMVPPEHTSDKQACYSFIDPRRMKVKWESAVPRSRRPVRRRKSVSVALGKTLVKPQIPGWCIAWRACLLATFRWHSYCLPWRMARLS